MSEIRITGLTFGYEGSTENVFEDVTFSIDTDWKLGLIGRNGKGKTTLLRLLMSGRREGSGGKRMERPGHREGGAGEKVKQEEGGTRARYSKETLWYQGSISADTHFDYFPYEVSEEEYAQDTILVIERLWPDYEFWKICRELTLLETDAEILYRPYGTLSHGERTKVMLALLFSREQYFLLIDEPTNHLDAPTRRVVCEYLKRKKGFILVSHDRELLDGCIDHVLALERSTVRVEQGNFSSWQQNKERRDQQERSENEKLKQEIAKLHAAAERTARWADQAERQKIGRDPIKEHDRPHGVRAYIGEKSRRMQQQRKNLERRQEEAVGRKQQLLHNLDETAALRLNPLAHHKERYIRAADLTLGYGGRPVLAHVSLELCRGERIVLQGKNGCGKSSLLRAVRMAAGDCRENTGLQQTGTLEAAGGLILSYVSQDTSMVRGTLDEWIEEHQMQGSLLKAVLRQIGFEREMLEGGRDMRQFSEGQRKKLLIASSLISPAHLYIWDEPLNYIDVFSRIQIEDLILQYQPTMLLVEHDSAFARRCGTRILQMDQWA